MSRWDDARIAVLKAEVEFLRRALREIARGRRGDGVIADASAYAAERLERVAEVKKSWWRSVNGEDAKISEATYAAITCPSCQKIRREQRAARKETKETQEKDTPMAVIEAPKPAPSTTAIKAQVAMMRLLEDNFDADAGAYATGWSDERVANETGLALSVVTNFRREGYGEIKRPSELTALASDINALAELQREQAAGILEQLQSLQRRLASLEKTWPR